MGTDLSFFYKKYNFKFDGNLAYGIFENKIISVRSQSSYIKVTISLNRPIDKINAQQMSYQMKEVKSKHKILQQVLINNISLEAMLYQASDLTEDFEATIKDIINTMNSFCEVGIETCPLCGNVLTTDTPFIRVRDCVIQAHDICIRQLEETNKKINSAINDQGKKVKMILPILYGIGSVLLIVAIFTLLSLVNLYPYFVGLTGWLCYYLIRFIYKKCKIPFVKKTAIILTACTIICLLLSTFTGSIGYFYKNLNGFTILNVLENYFEIFRANKDVLQSVIYSLVWGILLAGIPIVFMFIQLKQSRINKIKRL